MRNQKQYVFWQMCEICGKSKTGIVNKIHRQFNEFCCNEPNFKHRSSLDILNYNFSYPGNSQFQKMIEEEQIEYGIAWGVE
jgi:hypothetical protein